MAASPRQSANLSLDPDLLAEAKVLKVNLSRSAEDGIRRAVAEARKTAWLKENAEAIESSNHHVENHGLQLERYRQF